MALLVENIHYDAFHVWCHTCEGVWKWAGGFLALKQPLSPHKCLSVALCVLKSTHKPNGFGIKSSFLLPGSPEREREIPHLFSFVSFASFPAQVPESHTLTITVMTCKLTH